MGIRGELFTKRINCNGRSYFFNVKENRKKDIFINIVEEKENSNPIQDRRSIIVFQEDLAPFIAALDAARQFIDSQSKSSVKPPASGKDPIFSKMMPSEKVGFAGSGIKYTIKIKRKLPKREL